MFLIRAMTNNQTIIRIKPTPSGRSVIVSLLSGIIIKLPIDSLVTNHLSLGSVVSQDLIDYSSQYQLQEYALSCLARSAQTEKILRQKLKFYAAKHHLDLDGVDLIIKNLNSRHLLDQTNYVRNYLCRYPRKSYQMLKSELTTRGIDQSILNQILIQDQNQELSSAINLIRKKHPTIEKLHDPHQKMLILSSIVRNGFSYSVAKNAIDAYLKSL